MAWNQVGNIRGPAGTGSGGASPPAYAGARARSYDPVRHLYGGTDTALTGVRKTLLKAWGGVQLATVVCMGDSQMAGAQAVPGTNDAITKVAGLLSSKGVPLSGGWVYPANNLTSGDSRWTINGSWTGKTTAAANSNYLWTNSAASNGVFTGSGTTLEFIVASAVAINGQYSIDGGATVTFPITPNTRHKVTVTGLSAGTHTVTIAKAPGNSSTFWLGPARLRTTSGLSITNAAVSGSRAADWLPGAGDVNLGLYNMAMGLESTPPDLVIVGLGGNEMLKDAPLSPSDVTSRLVTIGQAIQAAGSALILRTYLPLDESQVSAVQGAGSEGNLGAWISAMYDAADTLGVALIDHVDDMPDNATLRAAGLASSDQVHPLAPGYSLMARRDYTALTLDVLGTA